MKTEEQKQKDREYSRRYRRENPEWKIKSNTDWRKKNTGYWKKYYQDWRKYYNPEKHAEYYQKNKERYREKQKEWIEKNYSYASFIWYRNRPRVKKAEGSHNYQDWIALLEKFDWCCAWCGAEKPGHDHIVPLSQGGTDNIENIQPLCGSCNAKKGNLERV